MRFNFQKFFLTFASLFLLVLAQSCTGSFKAQLLDSPAKSLEAPSSPADPQLADHQPADSQPPDPILAQKIASAYIQAVTDSSDPKLKIVEDPRLPDQKIDFTSCNSQSSLDSSTCERIVYSGKNGRTLFMESIDPSSIFALLPPIATRKAMTMRLFQEMSDPNSASYATLAQKKEILAEYFRSFSKFGPKIPQGAVVTTAFDGISESRTTEISIDLRIDEFPKYYPIDALYYWALNVNFTPVLGRDEWWGHIGLQVSSNPKCGVPDGRCANWGGGGASDGTGNYGFAGSIVKALPWEIGVPYTMRIVRSSQVTSGEYQGTWIWKGFITDPKTKITYELDSIIGGEYILTNGARLRGINSKLGDPGIFTETGYGVICTSPSVKVTWMNLKVNSVPVSIKAVALDKDQPCANTLQLLNQEFDARTNNYFPSIIHGMNQIRPPGYQPSRSYYFQ